MIEQPQSGQISDFLNLLRLRIPFGLSLLHSFDPFWAFGFTYITALSDSVFCFHRKSEIWPLFGYSITDFWGKVWVKSGAWQAASSKVATIPKSGASLGPIIVVPV